MMNNFAKKFSAHNIFGSHMVLQRERSIVISGTADPDSTVYVKFAGKTLPAQSDASGEWSVVFPPMGAGGPYTMEISGAEGVPAEKFDDILVGEVWMCSGQSNMEMPMYGGQPFWRTMNHEEEIAAADYPDIRLYNSIAMRRMNPDEPNVEENGPGWECCTPESVTLFSACGYFFGRKLFKDLGVPVGLVNTAWGGTDIRAWISKKKYEECNAEEELAAIEPPSDEQLKRAKEKYAHQIKDVKKWLVDFFSCGKDIAEEAKSWRLPEYDDSDWETFKPPLAVKNPAVACVRGMIDVPTEFAGKDLTLDLGTVNDCDETFFNGEKIGETGIDIPEYWSILRKYTIPGRLVKAGKNLLFIRIANHYLSGSWSTNGNASITCEGKTVSIQKSVWKTRLEFEADIVKIGCRPDVMPGICQRTSPNFPTTLFNGMMYPWFKYQFRGVIWYQGCSNSGQRAYYPLHKMMINDWREHWNDPDVSFLIVQLAAYGAHQPDHRGDENDWKTKNVSDVAPYALTREIQAEMPKVMSKTGMIVAFDAGDQFDIHPRDKQILGYRLALEAERIAYGKNIESRGPSFRCFQAEGNTARVFFEHGDGLKTSDGTAPDAFALSADGKRFVWADAKIDGDTVIVSSPEITSEPKAVRYAFVGFHPHANLQNGAGLPAEPFRSDKPDWENMKIDF